MTDFDKHALRLSAGMSAIQIEIGTRILPTIKRLLIALEMAERWYRSREATKRAVLMVLVLFVMLGG